MNVRGFTLVEVMVVVAIVAVLAFLAASLGASSYTKSQLSVETEDLILALRRAQSRTVSGYKDGTWGVHLTASGYTLFKGSTYAGRDSSYDEVHTYPPTITGSGLSDVIFVYRTGKTSNTGTITLTLSVDSTTGTVSVNSNGRIIRL
jgi:prepilin-type N-terminal cleavage/methylation domain-containing protein